MKLYISALTLLFSAIAKASVIDLTKDNFDDIVIKSGKPSLVKFYAPWCGHCKKMAPAYDELAEAFKFAKGKVNIAKCDGDAQKSLSSKYKISGFPTLKWFDGKGGDPIDYESGRDLESMSAYITEKTKLKPKGKKETPTRIVKLTDDDFQKIAVEDDKDVFVKFYAPWCGHCKNMQPDYIKVADDFALDTNVVIAEIDCDAPTGKKTMEKYGVSGFPTLKFFPRGKTEPIDYNQGRSELDIVEFINEHCGTHRLPGGTLNDAAGTIEKLDTLIFNRIPASLAEVTTELKKATADLKDKYAAYYLRVAEKIKNKATYVEEEIVRLEKMLEKGGLAPEKQDDFKIKSNILRKFQPSSTEEPSPAPIPAKDEL